MNLLKYLKSEFTNLSLRMLGSEDRETFKNIFLNILKSRIFEKKVLALVSAGEISKQPIFSGIGQEGGQAAISSLLNDGDYLIQSYRGYTPVISRNFPIELIAAEIMSKKNGPSRGIGSSNFFTALEYNIFQSSLILGLDFGTIIGLSLSLKKKNLGKIAILFFGDGAATRGPLWSALNLSVLWRLPILWVCENNQYSMTTHVSKNFASSFFKVADSFGLTAKVIEGNDAINIFLKTKPLVDIIRKKSTPGFIELKTYRISKHDEFFMTDRWYQDKNEWLKWSLDDPLEIIKNKLLKTGIISQEFINSNIQKIELEVEEAFKKAKNLEELTKEELLNE